MAAASSTAVVGPELVTSPEDKRSYRRITLANGLVAVLIHDPHMLSEASAACDADGEEEEEDEEDEEEGEEEDEEDEEMCDEPPPTTAADAPSKKAAIALSVSVGSFSDPEEAQGLSHFLEARPAAPGAAAGGGATRVPPEPPPARRAAHGVHGFRSVSGRERVRRVFAAQRRQQQRVH
jgi:hypothetical protein